LPLITEPIPKTHVEAAVVHLNEATQDGGAALNQAGKDAKSYADVVADNKRLKDNDPARKFLYRGAAVFVSIGVVCGLIAYFFARPKLYEVAVACGFLACLFVGVARFIGPIEVVGFVVAVAFIAVCVYFGVRWFMAQRTTTNIVESLEKAKNRGELVLSVDAKRTINDIQTDGTKAVVAKIAAGVAADIQAAKKELAAGQGVTT
jgi:hypothetical protein